MWAGTYFERIKQYLQQNEFDILCFEEVAGIGTKHGNVDSSIDCFEELKNILKNHNGKLAISQYDSSNPKTGYFGNAIFWHKDFALKSEKTIDLFLRRDPFPSTAKSFEEVGRNALSLNLEKNNIAFTIICTHLALAGGTKIEQPFQRKQNKKLISYVKEIKTPFILTGDFNIDASQPSVVELGKYASNLTKEFNVKNTIDPELHRKWERIKPGFPIDFIFVSRQMKVRQFTVLDSHHLSDHFALTTTVEL